MSSSFGFRISPFRLVFLAAALFATAFSSRAADKTVVFFGDSLTAGYGLADPDTDAYPALIQAKIKTAGLPWKVVNAGLSGDTSAAGLRRIDWVLRQPMDLFVLALGANDGLRGIAPETMRSNLQAIIDKVRAKYSKVPIVVTGMMMPPSLGPAFTRDFDAVFPEVAKKNNATLVPFLLDGVAAVPDLNQGDQIHPNRRGAVIVADNVWKVLEPLLAKIK